MPNKIFPIPTFKTNSPAQEHRGLWSRLRHRRPLDSRAERARLANALVTTVGEARRGEPMNIRKRPQRAEVRACAPELLALADRLRESSPVDVRGIGKVAALVDDRRSPLYRPGPRELRDVIVDAYASLIPSHAAESEQLEAA
jgi:hypothetical protein